MSVLFGCWTSASRKSVQRVVEANAPLLTPDRDYWVSQRISRGLMPVDGEELERPGPTVLVDCTPLPLSARAPDFRDGIEVVVPSVRRTPPESMSPRAKMCNYINLVLGRGRGRFCWILREISPKDWAAISFWFAAAPCSRRERISCFRGSAGRWSCSSPPSSASRATRPICHSTTPVTPKRLFSRPRVFAFVRSDR